MAAHLHMELDSSERGQCSQSASMAVRGMVTAVSRSDNARLIIRIFLRTKNIYQWCQFFIMYLLLRHNLNQYCDCLLFTLYCILRFFWSQKQWGLYWEELKQKTVFYILKFQGLTLKTCENCNWDVCCQYHGEANIVHRLGSQIVLCKLKNKKVCQNGNNLLRTSTSMDPKEKIRCIKRYVLVKCKTLKF